MKKIIALFLMFCIFGTTAVAVSAEETSVVMAINDETFIVNGQNLELTAPIMALDRTYVDLYAVAPLLNIGLEWVQEEYGFVRATANGVSCDFKIVGKWQDLKNEKYKCFVKDNKIFASVRELNDLAGCNLTYDNGIITIGKQTEYDKEIFGNVSLNDFDDYVYTTYPSKAEYVVYPYQKYSYELMLSDAQKLKEMYPELIKISSIGKSVEGRDLPLIKFGRGENKIFVCGTHHAREYITTTYLMYAIDRYAFAYRNGSMWGSYNVKEILDNATFYIVPMVNPDGVNLVQNGLYATKNPEITGKLPIFEGKRYGYAAWKANINGVDLNWNYDKDWSVEKNDNPRGSSGFRGDGPATEPESIAVANYVDSIPFDAFVSYHTQGQIFYWSEYTEKTSNINKLIKKDTGFIEYPDDGTGVGGSFFDYVSRKYRKPTITIELCPYIGNYPYPDKDFDTVWKPAKNILLIVGSEIIKEKTIAR